MDVPIKSRPKIALLEFMLSQNQLFTFVVRADWPEKEIADKEPLVFSTDMTRDELATIARDLESLIRQVAHKQLPFEEADLTAFYGLSERIFSTELYKSIQDYQALYLVPFGELHHLPLHALTIQQTPLIDLFEVAYLPSASVLPYLETIPRCSDEKPTLLAVGVDSQNRKKHFHYEAQDVYNGPIHDGQSIWDLERSNLLIQKNALRSKLVRDAPGKDVVHISTHGHFLETDPLASGVSLFDFTLEAVASYLDGRLRGASNESFLSARDIIEHVPLKAELLVMSGCLTGMSEAKPGDELVGLTRGLLYAGAKSLVVSLFPTYKWATVDVLNLRPVVPFSEFYRLWLGEGRRKSNAFQAYIQAIKAEPANSHPFNWFSLIFIGQI